MAKAKRSTNTFPVFYHFWPKQNKDYNIKERQNCDTAIDNAHISVYNNRPFRLG